MSETPRSSRTRNLLIAATLFLIAVPVFAALHNLFYALASLLGSSGMLSDTLALASTVSFLLAVAICPAGTVFCLIAALLIPLTAGWRIVARRIVLAVAPLAVAVGTCVLLAGWFGMSTVARDEAAGFNGSFEFVAGGLPANWNVYDRPLDDGDAELVYDADEPVDGEQSLEMVVHRADRRGGWRSAGIFQNVDAVAGRSYRVSFWLKNRAAVVRLRISSEKGDFRLPHESVVELLEPRRTGTDAWRRYAYDYTVPDGYEDIRVELNVLAPGTVWIDDMRIESLVEDEVVSAARRAPDSR